MNSKLYAACGVMALGLAACSGENGNITGTSTEPNPTAQASSSSVDGLSSSSFVTRDVDLWNPGVGDVSINAARYAARLPANAQADGHWFWEARGMDENEGGQSSIIWPVALGGDVDSLSTVIESCQGICGIASLKKGSMTMQPYAGVGFVLAKDAAGKPVPMDVSDWNGVCVTYTSDVAPSLVLDLGDSLGALLDDGFGFPAVTLPEAHDEVTECLNWSQFEFPKWKKEFPDGWSREVGVKASKQLVGLMFRIQNVPGEYNFNIKYFGTKADGALEPETPVLLSGAGEGLWAPSKDADRVKTSSYSVGVWPENAVEDGRWFWGTDESAGGQSSVQWPVALGGDGSLAPVVESCKGICGVASLKKGSSEENPYVSFSFGIAKDASGAPLPVDISNWNGLCFEYYSETPVTIELVVSDSSDGLPWTGLRSSQETRNVCVNWGDFRLPKDPVAPYEGGSDAQSVEDLNDFILHMTDEWNRIYLKVKDAIKQTIAVRLKIEAAEEYEYKFGIGSIDVVDTSSQTDSEE